MKIWFLLVLSASFAVLLGSCRQMECDKLNNPSPHGATKKWDEFPIAKDTVVYGDFVLRKGESVDNGKIRIEVVELFPAKCGFFVKADDEFPQVRLRFLSVPDQRVILDFTFRQGSARLDTITKSPEEMPWSVIEISDVHARDNWVAFNLRKRAAQS